MMNRCNGSSRSKICSKGRHFDRQIIVLCVSWYTSFKLSLRDFIELIYAGFGWKFASKRVAAPS
jgi:transposase-like protein